MKDYWGIEIRTDHSKTTTGGFLSPEAAAKYLVGMIADFGDGIETATIYKYMR